MAFCCFEQPVVVAIILRCTWDLKCRKRPLVAFQWDATPKVWTYNSKVMRFLRFQVKFRHAVNHYQCSKICPKLPKTAQIVKICPKTISSRNFEIPPKIEILVFYLKKNTSMCRRGTKAWVHHLDFQSKNFPYSFFNVIKRPLYVNLNILLCAKWCFLQGSIYLVDMRFCWPNSPRNKNLKFVNPYLF
jgi:hypothetical protein